MNEALDFNAYVSYFLIAAYYVIMLRLWLPPPPSDERKAAGNEDVAGQSGKSTGAVLRQVKAPLADHSRELDRPEGAPGAGALERIRAADNDFDEGTFLSGAAQAYELVVNAYAKGDTATLNGLLGAEVAGAFRNAGEERRKKGETLALSFVGIQELEIADAWLDACVAELTVRFVSELVTVTRAADDTIVEGDPEKIVTMKEMWTFARRIPSSDPNWKIVATDEG